jgi:hypothetical protein
MVAAFVVVVGLLGSRTLARLNVPGSSDREHFGLIDFRDAIYYPVRAFLDGRNPYDVAAHRAAYPVGAKFPLYSPLTLVIHAPFGLLPFEAAELAYFLVTILLVLALARLALTAAGVEARAAHVCGLAALVLASRPGHQNLLAGQCTVQVVLAASLALLHARTRPLVAGLGLAVATLKPTFGVPLALLMVARGDLAAVALGALAASAGVAVALPGLTAAAGGMGALVDSMRANYAGSMLGPLVHPALSPFRVDAVATLGRFLGRAPAPGLALAIAAAVLGLAAAGVRRLAARAAEPEAHGAAFALAALAILLCTYHQPYDVLLLTVPIAMLAAAWSRRAADGGALARRVLPLLLLPAVNYVATRTVLEQLAPGGAAWLAVTSLNGAALLGAFVVLARAALRAPLRAASRPPCAGAAADAAVEIGAYRPGEEAGILDCLRASFGLERDLASWRRFFFENPAGAPIIVTARARGAVVSHTALLARRMRVGDGEALAGHSLWAMSRPAWQRHGLSSRLGAEAARLAEARGFAAIYGFANEQSLHGIVTRQGRDLVRRVPVMVRPLRPLHAARALGVELWRRRRSRASPTVRLLASLGDDPAERAAASSPPAEATAAPDAPAPPSRADAPAHPSGWSAPAFDARHSELFRAAEALPPIGLVRDAAYLRWRYPPAADSPYLVREARSAAGTDAMVVVRVAAPFGFRLVFLMEWLWRAGAHRQAHALLGDVLGLARAAGADGVAALAMPGTSQRRWLRRRGFVAIPAALLPGSLTLTVRPLAAAPSAARWREAASWHLTWGDGDVV